MKIKEDQPIVSEDPIKLKYKTNKIRIKKIGKTKIGSMLKWELKIKAFFQLWVKLINILANITNVHIFKWNMATLRINKMTMTLIKRTW